jgi:hypothetical protein
MGTSWLGAAAEVREVGPTEASGTSSVPSNMEDVETYPEMATVFHLTDAGHFSLKVERYSDGGGVSRPGCGWSQQHQIEEYFF